MCGDNFPEKRKKVSSADLDRELSADCPDYVAVWLRAMQHLFVHNGGKSLHNTSKLFLPVDIQPFSDLPWTSFANSAHPALTKNIAGTSEAKALESRLLDEVTRLLPAGVCFSR